MACMCYYYRCLPRGLVTLQEWLTEDVPSDWWVQDGVSCSFGWTSTVENTQFEDHDFIHTRTFNFDSSPEFVLLAKFHHLNTANYSWLNIHLLGSWSWEESSGL